MTSQLNGCPHFIFYFLIQFFIVSCRLCVIYVREGNDYNIYILITQLVWTTWTPLSSVPKKLLNLITHSPLGGKAEYSEITGSIPLLLGLYSLKRYHLTGIGIPIIDLRWSDDHRRFIMGMLYKTVMYLWIEAQVTWWCKKSWYWQWRMSFSHIIYYLSAEKS